MELDILRKCGAGLQTAASGLRCWGVLGDAANRPRSPPSGGGVLAWSRLVATGRRFKLFAAFLGKGCIFTGVNTAWGTKAVVTAGCGLSITGTRPFRRDQSSRKKQLTQIAVAKRRSDGFALIDLISSTVLHGVPTGCFPVAMQRAEEELTSNDRMDSKAVVGLADRKLFIKLNKSEHMASGPRRGRAGFRKDYSLETLGLDVPQLFCPVCRPWPAITRIPRAGGTPAPNWTARRLPEEPRSFAFCEGLAKWGGSGDAFSQQGSGQRDSRIGELIFPAPSPGPMAPISLSPVRGPGSRRIPSHRLGTDWGPLARRHGRAFRGFPVARNSKTNRPLA